METSAYKQVPIASLGYHIWCAVLNFNSIIYKHVVQNSCI